MSEISGVVLSQKRARVLYSTVPANVSRKPEKHGSIFICQLFSEIKNGRNVVKIKKVGNYVKQFFAGTGS
jgi:hypothetical protein